MVKALDFCEVQFYDNYLICVVKEGTTLSIEESKKLVKSALDYYKNKPFIYITRRINSYSVDPAIYNLAAQIENLMGCAVVSKNELALKNAEIEKLFYKKELKTFKDLDTAKQWAVSKLENEL